MPDNTHSSMKSIPLPADPAGPWVSKKTTRQDGAWQIGLIPSAGIYEP
jgi:hypothetical protein